MHVTIAGYALKARNARLKSFELAEKCGSAGDEFDRAHIARARRRTFDQIGKADTEPRQKTSCSGPSRSTPRAVRIGSVSCDAEMQGQNLLLLRAK